MVVIHKCRHKATNRASNSCPFNIELWAPQLHEEVEDIWKNSSSSALLDKLLHDFDNAKVVEVRSGRRCKFLVAQVVLHVANFICLLCLNPMLQRTSFARSLRTPWRLWTLRTHSRPRHCKEGALTSRRSYSWHLSPSPRASVGLSSIQPVCCVSSHRPFCLCRAPDRRLRD